MSIGRCRRLNGAGRQLPASPAERPKTPETPLDLRLGQRTRSSGVHPVAINRSRLRQGRGVADFETTRYEQDHVPANSRWSENGSQRVEGRPVVASHCRLAIVRSLRSARDHPHKRALVSRPPTLRAKTPGRCRRRGREPERSCPRAHRSDRFRSLLRRFLQVARWTQGPPTSKHALRILETHEPSA